MPNLTANYNFKKPLGTEKMDVNVLNENFDNIDEEIFKINNSKGKANGIATLDENGRIPQSQIGINCGFDVLYSNYNNNPTKVTINSVPSGYKYYEIVACGIGGYGAKNTIKVNGTIASSVTTSSGSTYEFFMKAVVSDKIYGTGTYVKQTNTEMVITNLFDSQYMLSEGKAFNSNINTIEVDTTSSSTSGSVKRVIVIGYK